MPVNLRPLLPRATTVGLGLIVLSLLVNMVVSEWNIHRLVENGQAVVHTQEVLTTIEEVLGRVTEAETAERGFLITGDANYLAPYEAAVQHASQTLDHLHELMAGDAKQQASLREVRQRVDDRFEELRQAIAAQRAGGFDAARQAVSTNHGGRLMNEMRALVVKMKEREEKALALRSAESYRSARVSMATDIVETALGIGMVGLAFYLFRRDLAHRRRAEETAVRLAAIVESSDDAIVSKTLDGTVVSWNAGAERIYSYTAAEMIGQPITRLCPPEHVDEVRVNMERVKRGQHIAHFETSRIRKDGHRIDVSLTISPLTDANGQVIGASAIARDITERKELQREVLEAAAGEQRRIGQDLHDGIGQELTGLAMLTQRLAGVLTQKAQPEARTADKIVNELEHTLGHVRALSKGLVPVEVDTEGLMFALRELATRTRELNAIHCLFVCDKPVRIQDNQTATHLYRMSQEAVTNAIKHGRARYIIIRLTSEGEQVVLEIEDDGAGYVEPAPDTTGTGLRIMRYRAELIGAQLTIGSVEPHGTRITCTLGKSAQLLAHNGECW